MWQNVKGIVNGLETILPISSMHIMGSFTTNKRRPADIDFIVLLKTKDRKKDANWSVDLVIAPDNKHGKLLLEDCNLWMKQKYGSKKSTIIQIK